MEYPSKIPGGRELINPEKLFEEAGLSEGMQVGDFGCGSKGYFSLQAAKMVGKAGLVYAVDILKVCLENVENLARFYGLDDIVRTVWSDLEVYKATAIPEVSLDFGLIINLLFQIKKKAEVITEVVRMIKPNGRILVVDWKVLAAPFGPPPEMKIPPEEIKKIAVDLGLILEKEFEAGPYHWALVFRKLE